ncbi:MAG: hypothetical protein ACLPXM_16710 [Terriglobales bacterium]
MRTTIFVVLLLLALVGVGNTGEPERLRTVAEQKLHSGAFLYAIDDQQASAHCYVVLAWAANQNTSAVAISCVK